MVVERRRCYRVQGVTVRLRYRGGNYEAESREGVEAFTHGQSYDFLTAGWESVEHVLSGIPPTRREAIVTHGKRERCTTETVV
jgi:hypothetical protein